MGNTYDYPIIYKGKEIGLFSTFNKLFGLHVILPERTVLKQPYNQKLKVIKIPIRSRIIKDTAVEITHQLYLDVSKKSKRQINIVLDRRFF